MGTLKLNYKIEAIDDTYATNVLSIADFSRFNVGILDLGNVSQDADTINTLAAVFDLEGFTQFCTQIDPQLVIPEYLNQFLDWLFKSIAKHFTIDKREDKVILWSPFPFFGKFLGDGVLFLWNTDMCIDQAAIGNIAISLHKVCTDYKREFFKKAATKYSQTPPRLRVGIARGQVLSIGGGKDFVGPCINMASRLQSLESLSFALSRRGFDPDQCFKENVFKKMLVVKTSIRGIGADERLIVYKNEFNSLSKEDKKLFSVIKT